MGKGQAVVTRLITRQMENFKRGECGMFNKVLLTLSMLLVAEPSLSALADTPQASTDQPAVVSPKTLTIGEKLKNVKTYQYYLSSGNASIGEKMKKVDLVIVEPVEMQDQYIKEAQKNGTLVYGYINAMEADKWNKDLFKQFKEEDFYHDKNGKRKYIAKWDAYLMNMDSKHYQEVLLKEIKKRVVDRKLDGVFFDTVGDIDDEYSGSAQQKQREGMVNLMKQVKKQYNGLSIAQNWGFETLEKYTGPYVDFIMWEDFNYSEIAHDDWSLEHMEKLKKVRAQYGTQIMAVSFKDKTQSEQLAKKHGFKFLWHPAGSDYNKW